LLVVATVVAVWGVEISAAEEADSPEAPAGRRAAAEVIDELLAARSRLGPLQAEFSWVIGPLGIDQQRFRGRLYLVEADRYRVDFESTEAGSSVRRVLMVPDGRWAYEYPEAPNAVGMRLDLAYVKRKVRSPAPRVHYDPTGAVLLELLRLRGHVTYEGDKDLAEGRCAVLSHQGASSRRPHRGGRGAEADTRYLTRLYYRWEDGLLVGEDETDAQNHQRSSYRVFDLAPFQPWEELLQLPEAVRSIDVTKQLVRRELYGLPRPVPGPAPRSSRPGDGAPGP